MLRTKDVRYSLQVLGCNCAPGIIELLSSRPVQTEVQCKGARLHLRGEIIHPNH